jgi:hypothetical protein
MGLSDKLKDLRKQAETAVAEHRDQITDAVGTIGVAANERTKGKYAEKIAKAGDKLTATVDKIGANTPAEASAESPFPSSDEAVAGPTGDPTTGNPSGEQSAPDFQ